MYIIFYFISSFARHWPLLSMKFNPVYEMVHASVKQPTTTRFLKVTINGIIAAYFYGCVASSTGFMILSGDLSQPNTVLMMDGNGNADFPFTGIPKHDTYPRPR